MQVCDTFRYQTIPGVFSNNPPFLKPHTIPLRNIPSSPPVSEAHPSTVVSFHAVQIPTPHSAGSSQGMPFSMDVDATPRKSVQQSQPQEAPQTAKKVSSHSRKGSGADSVTYVREPDPDGGGKPRWVLERRRTSEQGQLELVGRELVQGGWI